jgi:hypothetical protein
MPFTLNITFNGLCLFYSDGTMPQIVHVLMPAPDQIMPHMPVHEAWMHHDVKYDQPSGAPGAGPISRPYRLKSKLLDLSFIGGGVTAPLPGQIASLAAGHASTLNPIHLTDTPGLYIAARVTLAGGTFSVSTTDLSGNFTFGNARNQCLAYRVHWSGLVPDWTLLPWMLRGLNGTADQSLPPIYPDITQSINLCIQNVMADEVSSTCYPSTPQSPPMPGTPLDHFGTFYSLYRNADAQPPVPIFEGLAQCYKDDRGSPYTCIAGFGPP